MMNRRFGTPHAEPTVRATESAGPDRRLSKAVETLKAEIPELFVVSGSPRRGGDFSAATEGKRSFTAAEMRAMSASEYASHRNEIMAAMREGRYSE